MHGTSNPYIKKTKISGSDGLQFSPRLADNSPLQLYNEWLSRPI